MKKHVLFYLIALIVMGQNVFAQTKVITNDGCYTQISSGQSILIVPLSNGTAAVKNGNNDLTGNVVIPSEITCGTTNTTYTVTAIADNSFYCPITSLSIPNSVITIGNHVCSYVTLTSLTLGNSVTTIGEKSFYGCHFTDLTIPGSVTSIGLQAFGQCIFLSRLTIEDGVEMINGFSSCQNLTKLCLPSSVTTLGNNAFSGCINIDTIILRGNTPPTINSNTFNRVDSLITVIVPCGSLQAYLNSAWGERFQNIQEDNAQPFIFTVTENDTTYGSIEITQSLSCSNNTASFTAHPSQGFIFDHWSDGNTDNPRTLTVTQDTSLIAYFIEESFNVVAVNAVGGGVYFPGSTAVVFALPQVDLQFAGWSDGEIANPRNIIVTSDTTLTALYRAPDTVRVYDTTTVYDTVINMVYDTTEYNHYYYDTTHVYDTLIVYDTTRVYDTLVYVNIDTLHHYYYDTTRIFDTMVYVNIDTLNHYFYDTTAVYDTVIVLDTTRIYDTLIYVNIDTLHHYFYDTTHVFDTMVYVNIDTLNHYYYDTMTVFDTLVVYDTTRVYDTIVYVNIDTLHHYYYDTVINTVYDTTEYNHYFYDTTRVYDTLVVLDTTRVFDTLVFVNIDTLHHYYFDTTRVFDTLVNLDTVHHYFFDATLVYDTVVQLHIDTLHYYHYDTTHTVDTQVFYDTTSVTHYVFDSTWVFDSVWLFDSVYITDTVYFFDTVYIEVPVQGVDGVETVNVKVYTYHTQITVEGAAGMPIRLYDINGRLLATKINDDPIAHLYVQTSGTYLVRIGDLPARRVVVIR